MTQLTISRMSLKVSALKDDLTCGTEVVPAKGIASADKDLDAPAIQLNYVDTMPVSSNMMDMALYPTGHDEQAGRDILDPLKDSLMYVNEAGSQQIEAVSSLPFSIQHVGHSPIARHSVHKSPLIVLLLRY
jgi:hypothetical protein